MLHKIVFLSLLAACCAYAFFKGGGPERVGAAIFLAGTGLTIAAARASHLTFDSVEEGVLLADGIVLAALIALALRANRFWPLWVAGLQAIAIASHAAMMLHPSLIPWTYAIMISMLGYPMLLLLALGTRRHQARLKRNGADTCWVGSWRPSHR